MNNGEIMTYNLTCFASRKPIKENEECIIIPISSRLGREFFELSRNSDTALATNMTMLHGYSTMYWTYFSTPFKVRYDGKSGFVFEKSSESIRLLKKFLINLEENGWNSSSDGRTSTIDVDIDKYRDIKDKTDDEVIKLFEETQMAINQSRLYADLFDKPSAISFAVVSLSAYHALSKIIVHDVTGLADEIMEKLKSLNQKLVEDKVLFEDKVRHFRYFARQEIEKGNNPIYDSYGCDNHEAVQIIDDFESYIEIIEKKDWDAMYSYLVKGISRKQRFMQFNHALNKLNIKIMPIETDRVDSTAFDEYKKFINNLS